MSETEAKEEWQIRMEQGTAMHLQILKAQTSIPLWIGIAFVVALPLALGILVAAGRL